MVILLLACYDLFLYTIDFIICLKFMDLQYGKIRISNFRKYLLLVVISIFSGLLLWSSPFGGTYPFFSILFSMLFLPFYPKNTQKKILFSSIQFVVSSYLVIFVIAIVRIFEVNLRHIGINYVVMLGGMHLCFWFLIFLLGKISGNEKIHLPRKLFFIVLAIPAASVIVLIFFLVRINNNPSILFSLEIPLILVIMFINIVTAFTYSQFCGLLKKTTEVLLLKQQISLSEQYYHDLTDAQNKIKAIRHDMKNHLQSLLLMSGHISSQTKETKNIQEYLHGLLSDINETSKIISTGNLGIDAILSCKISQIKELNISV